MGVLLDEHGEPVLLEEWSCCDARVGVQHGCACPYRNLVEMRQEGAGDTASTELGSDKHHIDVAIVSDVGDAGDLGLDGGHIGIGRLPRGVPLVDIAFIWPRPCGDLLR
jgi:hypothetical protein